MPRPAPSRLSTGSKIGAPFSSWCGPQTGRPRVRVVTDAVGAVVDPRQARHEARNLADLRHPLRGAQPQLAGGRGPLLVVVDHAVAVRLELVAAVDGQAAADLGGVHAPVR